MVFDTQLFLAVAKQFSIVKRHIKYTNDNIFRHTFTHGLPRVYAWVTQGLRRGYVGVTQGLRRGYVGVT